MRRFTILLLSLIVSALPSLAQKTGWVLDKAHSSIGFSVRHLVISEVTGNFKDYNINFTSTKDDFSDAFIDATIKVASINTENDKRDAHLRTDDFFNAEKYPEIRFKSTSFEKVGDGKYKITGDLTIRDVTKKVTFDAAYNGSIRVPWGATVMSWKVLLTLNRFDYNLKWNKAIESGGLIAGEMVNITLNLELSRSSAS